MVANPLDGMYELVAEGKIIIITLPNGTNMIVAPEVLNKYHHVFKGDGPIVEDPGMPNTGQ
jgi:hypothetical protein